MHGVNFLFYSLLYSEMDFVLFDKATKKIKKIVVS